MTARDRFRMKSQILAELERDEWTWHRTNLLLGECGLDLLAENWNESVADRLADVTDDALTTMYSLVMDIDEDETAGVVETSADAANWRPGFVRVFLSHSAAYKAFAGEVADRLDVDGIHAFVAHETMEETRPWQAQIERALRSMQAFVTLWHPEVNDSAWCHQEIGWALGRRIPHYLIRIGSDPVGFPSHDQWPSGYGQTAEQVAEKIRTWVHGQPGLSETMFDGLIAAARSAGSYQAAGATAKRIASLGTLTPDQFNQLSEAFWSNDQMYGAVLVRRPLSGLYEAAGLEFPPPRPTAPDEAPF